MRKVRGYIFSRSFMGERVPQHIQNMVIRNYCNEKKLHYLLSATEYSMQNSTLILEEVISELKDIHGVVAYSLFQLPEDDIMRIKILKSFLNKNKKFYFANENFIFSSKNDLKKLENIWKIKKILPNCLNIKSFKETFDG